MGRTSLSWNRTDFPDAVARKTSDWPFDRPAARTSSPSSTVSAMIPFERGCENAERDVFLMTPFFVARTTKLPSANSRTASIAHTRSCAPIWIRLTTALPRPAELTSGISWTLSQ